MNKKWTLILLCACALTLMTGCATNADVLPSPSPSLMPGPSAIIPLPTATATATPEAANNGVMTIAEAEKVSNEVEAEIEKLSEVDTATAVVVGNMAIVGVTFDGQYKGGMTTRFTDMVEDRIGTVIKGVTNIGVTNDPELIKTIEEIKKTLADPATSLQDTRDKVSELISRVNMNTNSNATAMPTTTT